MRKCVRCGKKGLFLTLYAQKYCTYCSIINTLEANVTTISKQVAQVATDKSATDKALKELEQKAAEIEKSLNDLIFQINTLRLDFANATEAYDSITVREGDVETLVAEYVQKKRQGLIELKVEDLANPDSLMKNNILAVHFAATGAQGEGGAVRILYRSQHGTQILHGNYVYGNLNLDAVIQKLPMLNSPDVPEEWEHIYMGAMNHFFVKKSIRDIDKFIKLLKDYDAYSWRVFDDVAWFCGATHD